MSATRFYLLAQDGKCVDLRDKQVFGRETTRDVVLPVVETPHSAAARPAAKPAPPAKAVDVPTLTLVIDAYQGKQFVFDVGASGTNKWEIGRATSCDIVIDDPSVSSNHAQIINEGARWKLIDLMSANGTYVNGEKGLSTYLANGDLIRFGTIDAVIQLGGATCSTAKSQTMAASSAGGTRSIASIAAITFAVTLVLIAAAFLVLRS